MCFFKHASAAILRTAHASRTHVPQRTFAEHGLHNICLYARTHQCRKYVQMYEYVLMYVRMYLRMYVLKYEYILMYICTYVRTNVRTLRTNVRTVRTVRNLCLYARTLVYWCLQRTYAEHGLHNNLLVRTYYVRT